MAPVLEMTSAWVRLRLLGPVEVVADDVRLTGTKQQLALGLLALRVGEVVPTDALVDVLWFDDRPRQPERSLQVHISNLRGVLDDAGLDASVEHRSNGYVLSTDPGTIDAHRFVRLTDAGIAALGDDAGQAREMLVAALDLWRGEPLGGMADHPTLRIEVSRLNDLRVRALEARIDADLATGRHRDVASELRRLTDEFPLREPFWGQLMLALYRSGQPGEALATYERARRTLVEELGVDPSRELRDLHERILRQDPSLDAEAKAPLAAPAGDAQADPTSVAVLPFDVLGGEEDAELLALGLHSDLLSELSKIPRLTVISRTSVLGYAGTDQPVPRIARELNVGTVVEGTVQSAAQRLRLTVQVVDGPRGVHRWVESYDRELSTENLFAIQTELAHDIAGSLSAELAPGTATPDEAPPTDSLDAYRLVAKARQQFDLKTEPGFARAIELYREAGEVDPEYVDAWVGLADALSSMEAYGHGDRHELLPRAEQAVHRALALAPDSPSARTSLGVLHLAHQDGPASIRELERAIELQPSYADAHSWLTWVSLLVGRTEEAWRSAVRSVELDPMSPEPLAHLALADAATGRPEKGVAAARRAKRFSPYTTADLYEGICLAELGRLEEARQVLAPLTVAESGEMRVPWAGHGPDAVFALVLSDSGEMAAARAVLDGVDADRFPFAAGLIHLGLGEVEEASARFTRVGRMTAWPCLALHHYHGDVWETISGTEAHRHLVRTAYRSWQLEPPEGT